MKKIIFTVFTGALLIACLVPPVLATDDHNPIGVTGVFEGIITTGCAYNVLNHNARRGPIDDIVVPGSIGKYPLKMTRYYNSRRTTAYGLMGPGWSHEYLWISVNEKVEYPNGNVWDSHCFGDLGAPLGVSDWPGQALNGHPTFKLADGGTVVFGGTYNSIPIQIIDPYGQTTTITYYPPPNDLLISRVTEPGGRYLQFTYNGSGLLTRVDGYDGQGHQFDWVVYHYTATPPGGGHPSVMCLTSVDYSDGQHASYAYEPDNVREDPNNGSIKAFPLVSTCNDVRYSGPMRQIAYDYQDQGAHGAIVKEKYSANGPMVSSISVTDPDFPTVFTETRGDGPTRTFTYTPLHLHRFNEDTCPTLTFGPAPQQFLLSYTDFQNHSTQLHYNADWYIDKVTDANGHWTQYLRGPPPSAYPGPRGIGQILRITHPGDNTHIDYTYYDESPGISGHYLKQITDERGNVTYHSRDGNHRITRTDHKDSQGNIVAYEEFQYANNNFGLLCTHHLPSNASANGAYVHFQYDGRGLLIAKSNPTTRSDWNDAIANAPKTIYTYYTAADGKPGWIDRVKTMTLPANARGLRAAETYEYDLGPGNYSRGLVTKIQHADFKYQSFGYDVYGNKLWEENELRKRTSYTYDDYNRVLTVKDPIGQITGHTTTYTYNSTNGNITDPRLHTTNNPDTVTTPSGILTTNDYDQNFRKTSTTIGSSTTTFDYDNVGNPTSVTDPLNRATTTSYDARNRKQTVTDAYSHATTFGYDAASNVILITRPDGRFESKGYDAMNRLTAHTVPKTTGVDLTTGFGYWPSGKLLWVQDPKQYGTSLATYFLYNEADQMTTMYYPDPSLTTIQSWTYDDAHNLTSRTTVHDSTTQGDTQSFTYDFRNRKITMNWSNNADSASFTYYDDNRLWTASNPNSTITRTYDDAGRLTLDQQNVSGLGIKNVNYPAYDDDGKLTQMNVTGASYDYTFGYDTMSRFETIKPTGGSITFKYHYDAASNETQRDNLANGVTQYYPRDNVNRMQYMDVKKGATLLSHEGYGYDVLNRLISTTREGNIQDQFGYWWNSELLGVSYGATNRAAVYYYDGAGNRTSAVDSITGTTTYTLNPDNNFNEYSQVGADSVTNGSRHEISDYQTLHCNYVNDERLKSVTSVGNTYNLYYDALGRCVKRTLNGATTYYIYDGEKPILEYTNGTVAKNLYGKGIDEIVMRTDPTVNGGAAFYYQQDHEGSVTHLTNASGTIIERYRYDVFGAPTFYNGSGTQISSTAYNNRFLFTGREYAATYQGIYVPTFKFYEYRARAYNPTLGRFMSEDHKLADTGDYNLFRYCHNDPIDFTDPMGLEITLPPGPNHASPLMELAEMTKWFDRSNLIQGNFAGFASQSDRDAKGGFVMGQISRNEGRMYSYGLKPGYNIGDLSGARGYQYVWDSDPNCSGQCMTTVQHVTGAPSSRTPLVRGAPVGPNTKQGTAIATGFKSRGGQWVYPSEPTGNHAALYVASLGGGIMQTLEAQKGVPLHLDKQLISGWYEVTSRLAPVRTSTSELRPWTGPVPW